MATKKTKTKAVAVVKKETAVIAPARKMAWGGVMPKNSNDKDEIMVREFCNSVAKIYGVPSMGVNAMGGQPYLNNNGRLYLLNDLRNKNKKGVSAVKSLRTSYVQLSTGADVPAIVKATLTFKDGTEYEATGEASKQSVKLDAVKQTLNMMAETRAKNRVIWTAIGGEVWDRVAANLATSDLSEDQKAKVAEAGKSSYEEMQRPNQEVFLNTDADIIDELKMKVDTAPNIDTLMDYATKLGKSQSSKVVKDTVGKYIQEKVKSMQ